MQVEHICVGMADDYGNRRWRKGVLTLRPPNEIMGSGYSHTCDMPRARVFNSTTVTRI